MDSFERYQAAIKIRRLSVTLAELANAQSKLLAIVDGTHEGHQDEHRDEIIILRHEIGRLMKIWEETV